MKLRNHTDQWKRDYDVQPPLTDDEVGALDTQPITPLDEQIDDLIAFGKRLDAGDVNGDDDDAR